MRVLFLLLIGGLGTAVLVGLGVWQLQRLAWKEGVLAEIEASIAAPPVAVPVQPDPETDRFLSVEAVGALEQDEIHVLVSAKGFGAGYRIIRAMNADGRRVMVDLGIVPTEAKDRPRPSFTTIVRGNLHWPEEVDGFTPENDLAANIWFAREVPKLAEALDAEPILIIASSLTPPLDGVTPFPVDTSGIPNDHLGYAATWFGLAGVWVSMTGLFLYRGRRKTA